MSRHVVSRNNPIAGPIQEACDGRLRGVASPLLLRLVPLYACSVLDASAMVAIFFRTIAKREDIICITVGSVVSLSACSQILMLIR